MDEMLTNNTVAGGDPPLFIGQYLLGNLNKKLKSLRFAALAP